MGVTRCNDGRCFVPQGTFVMGSQNGDPDESPVRKITVSSFWMAKTEASIGAFKKYLSQTGGTQFSAELTSCINPEHKKFIGQRQGESRDDLFKRASQFLDLINYSTYCHLAMHDVVLKMPKTFLGCNEKENQFPVAGANYHQQRLFCQYYGGDIPTAAQVERASRGKSGTDEHGTNSEKAVTKSNGYTSTAIACGENNERANDFGICDLAGNLYECTRDQYIEDVYTRMAAADPHHPITILKVVMDASTQYFPTAKQSQEVRGGAWSEDLSKARSSNRDFVSPLDNITENGIRCVWPEST